MAYDDEELGYNSSSPLLGSRIQTKPQDEMDLPALKRVQAQFESQIASYSTITRLVIGDPNFSIEQQLAVNAKVVEHLLENKAIVDVVIDDIKEKYSDDE